MASFILLHGAWHGGWSFDLIKPILEKAGHTVIAPDLPGMPSDGSASERDLAQVSLDSWAEFAARLCREQAQNNQPVILTGHSRAGIILSQAAEKAPDAIDATAYICAMMLPDGVSRAGFKKHQEPNPRFDTIRKPWKSSVAHIVDPENLDAAAETFAQLAPRKIALEAAKRLVPEPSAPTSTPLSLSDEGYGRVPRFYIECTQDRTIPIADQRKMIAMSGCKKVITLDSDHSPFLSQPASLAETLLAISNELGQHTVKPASSRH